MTAKDRIRAALAAEEATLRQGWEAYERETTLNDAPPQVREAFRRTYYAGACAAYILALHAAAPASEAEGEARLAALGDDIQAAVEELGLLESRGGL